jgi:acyl-coenzyme A synthetase/AMP-(fatty) acid ligase
LAARQQLTTALALIELDGLAQRITLCPRDLDSKQLSYVFDRAGAEAVVSDIAPPDGFSGEWVRIAYAPQSIPIKDSQAKRCSTEWVLLTSGTTSAPKLVLHNFRTLTAAIKPVAEKDRVTWGTFYDICRYGGLQVFLRVIIGGACFVLSEADEPVPEYLDRLACHGATHVLGTPTHWRRALMTSSMQRIAPRYVRLSGEISDQAILDVLSGLYPGAVVAHAFASTEAGVGFAVNDGLEGFPASTLDLTRPSPQLKIEDGSIRLRSEGNALQYIGGSELQLKDKDGFVDTGDAVELRDGRYYFLGRLSGVINVGGIKVYPEEVEGVINSHPKVKMSVVRARKNPILGSIIVADVALREPNEEQDGGTEIKTQIFDKCRAVLSKHKIPTAINFVPSIPVGPTGKVLRHTIEA